MDDCFTITTTVPPTTTTQVISTTMGGSTTTTAVDCNVFSSTTCDITEANNLDLVHDVGVGTCQDMCQGNTDCNWFTWYQVSGLKGTCWLLDHCDSQEYCGECVSGIHYVMF